MDENGKAVCKCKGKYTGPTCKGNPCLVHVSQSFKVLAFALKLEILRQMKGIDYMLQN